MDKKLVKKREAYENSIKKILSCLQKKYKNKIEKEELLEKSEKIFFYFKDTDKAISALEFFHLINPSLTFKLIKLI